MMALAVALWNAGMLAAALVALLAHPESGVVQGFVSAAGISFLVAVAAFVLEITDLTVLRR